jgi:mRNA interferase YafQ
MPPIIWERAVLGLMIRPAGVLGKKLDGLLLEALELLASDQSLPQRHFDHPLSGEWSGFRDCHIRPDLVLIYEKPDTQTLRLVRLA